MLALVFLVLNKGVTQTFVRNTIVYAESWGINCVKKVTIANVPECEVTERADIWSLHSLSSAITTALTLCRKKWCNDVTIYCWDI